MLGPQAAPIRGPNNTCWKPQQHLLEPAATPIGELRQHLLGPLATHVRAPNKTYWRPQQQYSLQNIWSTT
jgi:hypothetical protein